MHGDFYNMQRDRRLAERDTSEVLFLRNFNNFIKSVLINDACDKLPPMKSLSVLDICCGKGGDLNKWFLCR